MRGLDVSSPAISGIAGFGHMLLTAGVIVLFFLIRKGVTAATPFRELNDTSTVAV